jgi:hypothetical protein
LHERTTRVWDRIGSGTVFSLLFFAYRALLWALTPVLAALLIVHPRLRRRRGERWGLVSPEVEPGAVWIKRVTDIYSKCVWLNPEPEDIWGYRQSVNIMRELMGGRMYPTTLSGLERAMRALAR